MMGHREKTDDGDERDCFSPRWRRLFPGRAGQTKRIKRDFSKRVRTQRKHALRRAQQLCQFDNLRLCGT